MANRQNMAPHAKVKRRTRTGARQPIDSGVQFRHWRTLRMEWKARARFLQMDLFERPIDCAPIANATPEFIVSADCDRLEPGAAFVFVRV